jgi:hypothetical protein
MAWFLFIDESGHDRGLAPYEVLAGIAVEDRQMWNLILAIHQAEETFFGTRLSRGNLELKGGKLLKRKTFRLASQMPPLPPVDRRDLARSCLEKGRAVRGSGAASRVSRAELTALGQAKVAFVEHVFELCGRHGARAFASIVDRDAPRPEGDFLRKDYSFLFERFFYFLDERQDQPQGVVVFDELERSMCHILIDQMARYFHQTAVGRWRSSRILPEPFFVHSEMTTLIQIADIVAYVISWGVRFRALARPAREDLDSMARAALRLRYRATRERDGSPFYVWSFAAIDDLRPRDEREEEE